MSILEGLLRGTGQASNVIGAQEQRRIAAEAAAREQSNFDRERLVESDNRLMAQGRREGYILADPKAGRLRLSDTFNERLAAGDQAAQEFAIGVANRGSGNRVPAGFQIDEIKPIKGQDGVTRYAVGGANADGSRGVLTVDGSSTDSSIAKQFDGSELAGFARLAFNSRNGFLYNQNLVDLNSFQNSLDLVASQVAENIFDATQGNPEVQRAAGAVIANSETDEERVENINKLAADVGVEPIPQEIADQAKTQSDSDPESATTPAPKDNSAQIAKLEKELAAIEGRKTGTSRANVRAAERKRAEIQRLKDESEPEGEGIMSKVLAAQNRTFGGSPIPAQVEEVVAPVVEGKTIAEIDEAVDNGELRVDPETARAAAEDLQNEGVNTAADLAKLDPRRQAFAYAMIIASTPNDGNRRAVRDQLINVLETGVSDRGAEARQQERLALDQQKFIRQLRKDRDDLRKLNVPAIQKFTQELLDFNFDDEGRLTGDRKAFFTTANRLIPSIQAQTLLAENDPETRSLLQRTGNQALGLVLQNMAASGNYGGAVDSFVAAFRPDVNNNINADLTGIDSDGELIFYGVRDGTDKDGRPTYRRQGEGVAITELRKINPDVANLLVKVAEDNMKARGGGG